jgi:photosystem II stability/assembly factor-like uncharacterized protein
MDRTLILATKNGVCLCEREGERWVVAHRALEDHQATAVLSQDGNVLAGTREGIWASKDRGSSWRRSSDGLVHKHIRSLASYPGVGDLTFAGTEPAGIFVSYDGGQLWRTCPEVAQMREQYHWSLPYSPQAGCVRGFAFHSQRAYAAVEDGAVLVSDDGGENWKLAPGSRGPADHSPTAGNVHSDVHSIYTHPSTAQFVLAPTGGGLYRSQDGGETWQLLYRCYTRAAWVSPQDPNHIVFGPASSVDQDGRIEVSRDGGATWISTPSSKPMPWKDHMVEKFLQVEDSLLAVLSNGELLEAPLATLEWSPVVLEAGWIMDVELLRG